MKNKIETLEHNIINIEKELHANNQYNRRNNIEIDGIPESVQDEVMEETAITILNEIGVDVTSKAIEACHRLPAKNGKKSTILKFVNRKHCEAAMRNKKKTGFMRQDKIWFQQKHPNIS